MSVGAEIAQHMFWAAERPFRVDNPLVTEQYPQPRSEGARFRQRQEMSVELECAGLKGGLESGNKLAAKDTAEHFDGQEEGSARGYPAGVIRNEAASGQHAVNMRMMLESLVPSVEHAEEADLGSQVPGIASDLQQSGSAGVKEQVVDHPFVLQRERR